MPLDGEKALSPGINIPNQTKVQKKKDKQTQLIKTNSQFFTLFKKEAAYKCKKKKKTEGKPLKHVDNLSTNALNLPARRQSLICKYLTVLLTS